MVKLVDTIKINILQQDNIKYKTIFVPDKYIYTKKLGVKRPRKVPMFALCELDIHVYNILIYGLILCI